jgi:hypothetical protein
MKILKNIFGPSELEKYLEIHYTGSESKEMIKQSFMNLDKFFKCLEIKNEVTAKFLDAKLFLNDDLPINV